MPIDLARIVAAGMALERCEQWDLPIASAVRGGLVAVEGLGGFSVEELSGIEAELGEDRLADSGEDGSSNRGAK